MKIALCLSGHLRTYKNTFESIHMQLINKYDCDVFISTWTNLGNALSYGVEYEEGKDKADPVISKESVEKIYSPIAIKMDGAATDPTTIKIKKDYAGLRAKNTAQIAQSVIMYYKIWDCNRLKREHEEKNGFKYDLVIRCRFDTYIKNIEMEKIDSCVQFIPGYMGVCDMMFLGPSQMMDDVCDLYTVLSPELDFTGFVNAENMLYDHVVGNHIPFQSRYDVFVYHRYVNAGMFDMKGNRVGDLPLRYVNDELVDRSGKKLQDRLSKI